MSSIKTKATGFIIGAAMIPLMGVGAHALGAALQDGVMNDYSLHHRFETAYSFKTPEDHKHYTFIASHDNPLADSDTHRYPASPYATYPAMLVFGLLGARAASKLNPGR